MDIDIAPLTTRELAERTMNQKDDQCRYVMQWCIEEADRNNVSLEELHPQDLNVYIQIALEAYAGGAR
jgi:hypothetical protein